MIHGVRIGSYTASLQPQTAFSRMRYFNSLLCLTLFPLFTTAQNNVDGVSYPLAQYRKQVVSHIAYTLALDITGAPGTPIPARENISFDLSATAKPLLLDFKAPAGAVQELEINGKKVQPQLENEHLVLHSSQLKNGANQVAIRFTAGAAALNRNTDYMYTLLVPERARTVFPCFDQPDLKAVFNLTLQLPLNWKAIANGPLLDSAIIPAALNAAVTTTPQPTGSYKQYRFKTSDTVSTYLFAFVAGKFTETTRNIDGRTIQGLFRETDTARLRPSLPALFSIQSNALRFMEDYTQIPYPFQQFNFAALPDFQFGGMEHPGAIQYKAPTLFLEESATRDQLNARSNLLSHETAHMWFGDLVTMRWFDDVWMKEVFANFMADKIGNLTVTDNNFDLKFLTDHYPAAYNVDRTQGTHPIRQQLDNLKDAGSMYGNIIYHKAPIMMRQLERLMGADSLRNGLREYLRTYAYSNASWPDLIAILDRHCSADLQAWNKIWVNESGRPVFTYKAVIQDGRYTGFTVMQKAEDGSSKIWPQFFEIALVYPDHTEEVTVNMNNGKVQLPELIGRKAAPVMIFNANGQGYGVFPVTALTADQLSALPNPLLRATSYLNLYENMLRGSTPAPAALLALYQQTLVKEKDELCLNLLLDQLQSVFWRFLPNTQRMPVAAHLEQTLWNALFENTSANQQKLLFKAYSNIALTAAAQDTLFRIWQTQKAPGNVKLVEDDYTNLAAALCIRKFAGADTVANAQLARIQNADRKLRWQFLLPALSADPARRDSFFQSLANPDNRTKEAWVATAAAYLHHPLRTSYSVKYIPQSLELVAEIQKTGDIFFPQNWLAATLGYYQSAEAAGMIRSFLQQHKNYNPKLKNKILQAADHVFRAEKLCTR